jgi:gamma-glutamyltranspeptidase/glutathione hydrolase
MLRHALAVLAAPLLLAACATVPAAQSLQPAVPGMVSAADPRAAAAGAQILRQGGSATDAAIAVMLALGVVEPQSSGIGGGGFLVWADRKGDVETVDGREAAPKAATPEWFLDANGQPRPFPQAVRSGLSVGVPGALRLAALAHRRHGKLAWAQLFQPAIALARDGFQITERGREFLVNAKDRAAADPYGLAMFYDASGQPVPVGTTVKNPQLAATLERIAREGPDAFYTRSWLSTSPRLPPSPA